MTSPTPWNSLLPCWLPLKNHAYLSFFSFVFDTWCVSCKHSKSIFFFDVESIPGVPAPELPGGFPELPAQENDENTNFHQNYQKIAGGPWIGIIFYGDLYGDIPSFQIVKKPSKLTDLRKTCVLSFGRKIIFKPLSNISRFPKLLFKPLSIIIL